MGLVFCKKNPIPHQSHEDKSGTKEVNIYKNEKMRSDIRILKNQSLYISHTLLISSFPLNKTKLLAETSRIFNLAQHPDLANDGGAFTSISNLMEKIVYLNRRNTSSAKTQ